MIDEGKKVNDLSEGEPTEEKDGTKAPVVNRRPMW